MWGPLIHILYLKWHSNGNGILGFWGSREFETIVPTNTVLFDCTHAPDIRCFQFPFNSKFKQSIYMNFNVAPQRSLSVIDHTTSGPFYYPYNILVSALETIEIRNRSLMA
jgi:hypothetical protein